MGAVSAKSGMGARRYAAALLDMAAEAKAVEQVERDLLEMQSMLQSSDDLRVMMASPLVNRGQQMAAVARALSGNVTPSNGESDCGGFGGKAGSPVPSS